MMGMKEVLRQAIADCLKELGVESDGIVIEHPGDKKHGDYATNVAMTVAKKAKKNPQEIAKALKEKVEGTIKDVERIEIAGPGFLNFFLTRDFFSRTVEKARTEKEAWGKNTTEKGQEVVLEYTSPNLFKPLHVGNLVGNIIGESLARLFTISGATVKRVTYPSDIGLTVAKGVWGIKETNGDPSNIKALGEAYKKGNEYYEKEGEEKEEIDEINQALYSGEIEELNTVREKGKKTSLEHIHKLCHLLGTDFDAMIFESETGAIGKDLVLKSKEKGIFLEDDGAVIFKGEKYGLHTRVFINQKGLPTYEAKDLGNFLLKQKKYPDWTRSIIITGSEQKEYFKVLIKAMEEVFKIEKEKKIEHIATGFLTLTTGKMSSRKGNVLSGEELLAKMQEEAAERAKETRAQNKEELSRDIAVAALKYQILKSKTGSDMVFDKKQAFSFEGDSGPYLLYTHARTVSLCKKAEEVGIAPSTKQAPDTVYPCEREIYKYKEAVVTALKNRSPHHLITYITELAGAFNTLYAKEQIVDPKDGSAPYKVAITWAVQQTLKNGLYALGIRAPEQI